MSKLLSDWYMIVPSCPSLFLPVALSSTHRILRYLLQAVALLWVGFRFAFWTCPEASSLSLLCPRPCWLGYHVLFFYSIIRSIALSRTRFFFWEWNLQRSILVLISLAVTGNQFAFFEDISCSLPFFISIHRFTSEFEA